MLSYKRNILIKNIVNKNCCFYKLMTFFHDSSKEKIKNKIYTQKKIIKREKLLGNVKPYINNTCDKPEQHVIAYYLNQSININKLKYVFERVGSDVLYKEPYFLYVESCEYFNQQASSALFFKNGCLVIWNMNKKNIKNFLSFCKKHIGYSIDTGDRDSSSNNTDSNDNNIGSSDNYKGSSPSITTDETYDHTLDEVDMLDCEKLEVQDVNTKSYINNSIIYLTVNNSRTTDKICFSYALLSAVRLNNLEKKIEKELLIENNKIDILNKKIKSNKLDLLSKQLFSSKIILHNLRYKLNIEQDILDVPDVLWELEEQKKLFLNVLNIFYIKQRVDLLNHRLTWTLDYLNSFLDYVNQKHSSRLERIIIIIIGLELLLGITQMINTVGL
ncbi:conserved protein, unknown function [Hepatocystis sp. ex Piliocolobus tephrosceles]|nr:conserved protein, unknown function [Hepatocystis sp. ex Piliocolobus tephrosceles]